MDNNNFQFLLITPGGLFDPNCQHKQCLSYNKHFIPSWKFLWAILEGYTQLVAVNLKDKWQPDGSALTTTFEKLTYPHGIYIHPSIERLTQEEAFKLCPGLRSIKIGSSI